VCTRVYVCVRLCVLKWLWPNLLCITATCLFLETHTTNSHTHTERHTHTHPHTRTHTYTRTHPHAHAHTRTHLQQNNLPEFSMVAFRVGAAFSENSGLPVVPHFHQDLAAVCACEYVCVCLCVRLCVYLCVCLYVYVNDIYLGIGTQCMIYTEFCLRTIYTVYMYECVCMFVFVHALVPWPNLLLS